MPFANAKARLSWTPGDYETRLTELRSEFSELSDKDRNSDDVRKSIDSLKREREDLDFEYRASRAQHQAKLDIEERAHEAARNAAGAFPASVSGEMEERKSTGELLLDDESYKNRGRQGGLFKVEMRGKFRDEWRSGWETRVIDDSTGTSALLRPVGQPYLPTQAIDRRRLWLRDAMTGGNTTLNAIPYVRELNAGTNATAATVVAPGGTKPDSTVEFASDLAPVRDIAVTMTVTNQTFEDNQTVMSYINGRLSYMVALTEEAELLNGSGTAPHLKGILQYSGVQTQVNTVLQDVGQALGAAIAKIQVVNGYPTAVVMHPSDYWPFVTKRAAGGSGTYDAGDPFNMTPLTVWGLPIIISNGIAAGTALVGDFRLAAQYFDRNQFSIDNFEQHSDYAIKNLRLLRAEERLALAVYRPDWFCKVPLATS